MPNYLLEFDRGAPEINDVYCLLEDEAELRRLTVLMTLNHLNALSEHVNYNVDSYQAALFDQVASEALRASWPGEHPSPSSTIPDESLSGSIVRKLVSDRTPRILTVREAEVIENATRWNSSKEVVLEAASARTKAAHSRGDMSLTALIEDLRVLEDAEKFRPMTALSPEGIIKNGIGPKHSANLLSSQAKLQDLKHTRPDIDVPEEVTHAAMALMVVAVEGAPEPVVVDKRRLVLGYLMSGSFVSVTTVKP